MLDDAPGNSSHSRNAVKYTPYLSLMLTMFTCRSQIFYLLICEMGLLKILGSFSVTPSFAMILESERVDGFCVVLLQCKMQSDRGTAGIT